MAVARRAFRQVDVFGDGAFAGNPVAVVHDAVGIDDAQMAAFAVWTNLSETTFLLPPRDAAADYRVRIFTPSVELPFAGHPTLGTARAWLEAGGTPAVSGVVVQECDAGLVRVREADGRLAFEAPPTTRGGPVDDDLLGHLVDVLRISRDDVVDAQWVVNGPPWVAVLLTDAAAVLAVRPGVVDLDVGVAGLYPAGSEVALEVRAFIPKNGATDEDPVTGSLNASLAQWLTRTGRLTAPYVAAQGAVIGRRGRIHVDGDVDSGIWVGGRAVVRVSGEVTF